MLGLGGLARALVICVGVSVSAGCVLSNPNFDPEASSAGASSSSGSTTQGAVTGEATSSEETSLSGGLSEGEATTAQTTGDPGTTTGPGTTTDPGTSSEVSATLETTGDDENTTGTTGDEHTTGDENTTGDGDMCPFELDGDHDCNQCLRDKCCDELVACTEEPACVCWATCEGLGCFLCGMSPAWQALSGCRWSTCLGPCPLVYNP